MDTLDLVYNAFTGLERNYARSKKTRTEYVKDKFGGDINVGSFLILNALSAEEFVDPEDIKKFSEVRRIFEFLKDNQDKLDTLSSFNLDDTSDITAALDSLHQGQEAGTGFTVVGQEQLLDMGAYHFVITSKQCSIAPIQLRNKLKTTNRISIYSPGMKAFFGSFTSDGEVKVGDILVRGQIGLSCAHK